MKNGDGSRSSAQGDGINSAPCSITVQAQNETIQRTVKSPIQITTDGVRSVILSASALHHHTWSMTNFREKKIAFDANSTALLRDGAIARGRGTTKMSALSKLELQRVTKRRNLGLLMTQRQRILVRLDVSVGKCVLGEQIYNGRVSKRSASRSPESVGGHGVCSNESEQSAVGQRYVGEDWNTRGLKGRARAASPAQLGAAKQLRYRKESWPYQISERLGR
ncbi:hypothetical protein K438DRAFT_872673 [Mycena galopus ATCC 62051]|nr:hypothetical protein K438DRAFT_872673 [Mycena galopus ATCC 62051]